MTPIEIQAELREITKLGANPRVSIFLSVSGKPVHIALEIIRLTADSGSCTNAALRMKFSTADIDEYGAAACADANRIAFNGPFEIVLADKSNGAPDGDLEALSRHPSDEVARFDQQFAETPAERNERQRKYRNETRIETLLKLIADLSNDLRDEGYDWSVDGLNEMRRRVANALPPDMCPEWLARYRDPPMVQS